MKNGDKVKVLNSPFYPDIIGKSGVITRLLPRRYGRGMAFQVTLDERPLIGGTRWCFGIEDLELDCTSKNISVGANCIRCNLFSEYQTGPYTCWSCKNGC